MEESGSGSAHGSASPSASESDGDEWDSRRPNHRERIYEVERIVGKRFLVESNAVEYKVRWRGFKTPTWNDEAGCNNCQSMIDEYERAVEAGEEGYQRPCQWDPELKRRVAYTTLTGELLPEGEKKAAGRRRRPAGSAPSRRRAASKVVMPGDEDEGEDMSDSEPEPDDKDEEFIPGRPRRPAPPRHAPARHPPARARHPPAPSSSTSAPAPPPVPPPAPGPGPAPGVSTAPLASGSSASSPTPRPPPASAPAPAHASASAPASAAELPPPPPRPAPAIRPLASPAPAPRPAADPAPAPSASPASAATPAHAHPAPAPTPSPAPAQSPAGKEEGSGAAAGPESPHPPPSPAAPCGVPGEVLRALQAVRPPICMPKPEKLAAPASHAWREPAHVPGHTADEKVAALLRALREAHERSTSATIMAIANAKAGQAAVDDAAKLAAAAAACTCGVMEKALNHRKRKAAS